MTDPAPDTVRATLHDLADDVAPVDLVGGVWPTAVRRRRRRRTAGAVGALVCVLAVGLVGTLGSTVGADRTPGPAKPERTQRGDGRIAGHPVWLGPSLDEETSLPKAPSALPGTVDVSGRHQVAGSAMVAALARTDAEGRVRGVTLVDAEGGVFRLETKTMDLVVDPFASTFGSEGSLAPSFTDRSLSPNGRLIAFVTKRGFVVDDIEQSGWTFVEAPAVEPELLRSFHWAGDRHLAFGDQQVDVRTGEVGPAEAVGGETGVFPVDSRSGQAATSPSGSRFAQGARTKDVSSIVDAGSSRPEAVLVEGEDPAMLVLDAPGRTPGCCPVVGWLDEYRVVYRSRTSDEVRLLVWDTRSGSVTRLTDLTGLAAGTVASFAIGQSRS